jgi:protein FRG1
MPKALHFKGDKKVKKKKRSNEPYDPDAAPSKALTTSAPAEGTEDDDSWVSADAPSDISGPIVIVLPTDTPSCLACDPNGKVYTSALENIVDGDAGTAEPHDVRQVFVANRVAGTESFSLKGHHGRSVIRDALYDFADMIQIPQLQQVRHPHRKRNRHVTRRVLHRHPCT